MKGFFRFTTTIALAIFSIFIISVPAIAQLGSTGEKFTTTFPFYVGNARMPAGSYLIRPSALAPTILTIENEHKFITAMIDAVPIRRQETNAHSELVFKRYGDTEFLNRFWTSEGRSGFMIEPTKTEEKLAAQGKPQEHSVMGH